MIKLLIVSAFCIACVPLRGAQVQHTNPKHGTQPAHVKPKQADLPQTTLDFKPVGDGLRVSAQAAFLGHTVCGADGTFYFNAIMLPDGGRQIIAVSPKEDEVSSYSMASIVGLVNPSPIATDAEGFDLYVLAEAETSEDLINHDAQPGSPEARKYTRLFVLRFRSDPSAPDVIPLDLPFQPIQFAATREGKFVFLGIERANRTPVLAVVDGSGELDHYIDAYQDFGSDESILANAPQQMKSQYKKMPEGAPLGSALVAAQFAHYRDSLLLLMPGSKPEIFTIRDGGALESTTLHLPAGFEAESMVPSDNNWLIRARDGAASSNELILMVNPSDGNALRIIRSPQFGVDDITCVRNGDYYGIHWPRGNKGNEKATLMEAAQ